MAEHPPCHREDGSLATTSGSDTGISQSEMCVVPDGPPAHLGHDMADAGGPLAGDVPLMTFLPGRVFAWCQPTVARQLTLIGKLGHVAKLVCENVCAEIADTRSAAVDGNDAALPVADFRAGRSFCIITKILLQLLDLPGELTPDCSKR